MQARYPVIDGTKQCSTCKQTKPVGEFYARAVPGKYHAACRECVKARMRKPPTAPPTLECEICGGTFQPKNRLDSAKFCSARCGSAAHRRRRGQKPFQKSVVDGRKRCNTCDTWKPVEDFTFRKDRNGGPISDCRPCMAARGRAYNASDRGRTRRYALKYGVTVEWYEAKLKEQGGRCAICLEKPAGSRRLAIDHCHQTGRARGLLCFLCNSALGRFDDSPERLRRATAYIGT